MVHIGKKIEEVVRAKRIGISELAELINKSRPLVYDIFDRESIDTALLKRLSEVLNFNFFGLYFPGNELNAQQQNPPLSKDELIELLKREIIEKNKALDSAYVEIEYLKKIILLLEEKLKRTTGDNQ